jgi:large subunit ribosomal protein L24
MGDFYCTIDKDQLIINKKTKHKMKIHIKKGDTVKVIAGDSKGQQGKVLDVVVEKYRALVEGANMVMKHTKANAKNSKGGIVKKDSPIHISTLMVVDNKGNATRIGRRLGEPKKAGQKAKLVRYSKKTGEEIK